MKKIVKLIIQFIFSFKNNLFIDYSSSISPYSIKNIRGTKTYKTIIKSSNISRNCSIDYGSKINYTNISGNVEIGRFVSISGPSDLRASVNKIIVKDFCSIASNVLIQEYNHKIDRASSYYFNKNIFLRYTEDDNVSKGNIIIEEDVWIGSKVVILSGVTIGRGSVIGAGSVVTKDIPRYMIAVGNPAKVIRRRFTEETITYLEKIRWWNKPLKWILNNEDFFNTKLH